MLEVSARPEIRDFEVAAYLISRAMLLAPMHAEESFHSEEVCFAQYGRIERAALRDVSPWTFSDFIQLTEVFPFSGAVEAINRGLFGTRVAQSPNGSFRVGIYATPRGQDFFFARTANLEPLSMFSVDPAETREIAFAQTSVSRGGMSISPRPGSTTGTLGGWLKEKPGGTPIGISNNHILSEFNTYGRHTEVIQPGIADGGGNVVGRVADFVPLHINDPNRPLQTTNHADVAWCYPDPKTQTSLDIGGGGVVPTGEIDLIHELHNSNGNPVLIFAIGKGSVRKNGRVTGTAPAVYMPNPSNPSEAFVFENQIELDLSSVAQGDSGSLILSGRGALIGGLLFAIRTPGVSAIAAPWKSVLRESGLAFEY